MGYQTLDSVLSLQDDELKLLENIRHCVNLRIKCERDYASSLLVVSICAHKSDLSEDIRNTGACKAWVSIALEMEALSKSVSSNAEELCEVLELLDELINEKRAMRKSFIEEHNKCSDKLDFVLKLAQKTQLEYQKYLINYKNAKSKYEDIYMKLPKNFEDRNSTIDKLRKKYSESKKLYTKVCQKLHELHNDYCLITREAKQYENDFRTRLIPTLMEYHRNILISSGEKWKVILQKFVQKTDLSNEKYKSMQTRMNICVENVNGICGDIMTKFSSHSLLPQIKVNFNDKLLEDCTGALKPNELVVDTFTVDSLRKKESELRTKLVATQNELRDKTKLLKHYEQEIQTLKAISGDNSNAKNGIHVRHRAIDIIKKEILYVETKHQRIHNLWEEVDKCLSKFAGIEVPSGLQLNADNNNSAKATMQVSHKSLASASSDTSQTYSPISWGRTLIRKLKRQKISSSASASVSTLATCHSSISRSSSVKQRLTLTDTDNELSDEEWFHGSLPRIESSKLLAKKGDFLVRRTMQKDKQCFVVSVLWNGFRHFIINIDSEGLYKFEGPSFTNISDLIEYYQYNKISITNKSGARLVTPIPRERWELNHDDIELKEKIGRGNFGDVYKGVLKKTGTGTLKEMPVAVKTCKINLPDEQKRKFLSEGRILKQHNHPNVVQLIGICVHKQPVMIVMELVDGGSLVNFLRCNTNRITLSLSSLMEMCIDAASGMEYLESKNCIHRDLAARNCLIGLPQRIVKISDFGMSREAPQLEYTVSDGMKQIPIKWTAPEALNYGRYTSLCDVWSFGILIWEIFTFGSTPYSGMSNAKARELIDNGYRLPCPPKTPDLVYKLMGKCWQYEPESRPHFSEITQTLRDIYKNIKRIDDCCREIEIAV